MNRLAHKWESLEELNQNSCRFDFREIDSLHRQWHNVRRDRKESDPNAYKDFQERIYRRWSIETGIIEGIYDIGRGLTQTLVEKGLNADLIDRSSINQNPNTLIKVLTDHRQTADYVTDSIRLGYPLSKFYIQELHSMLLRNQHTYLAVDQFGREIESVLEKGTFKKLPNNPTRPDGRVHEYCPPIQVESELDRLANLYNVYSDNQVDHHPLLVAAWLHHRFAQIHPFQDGNGRVARALLTWHLAKGDYLPIVISRDEREEYIETLENADAGDLTSFVKLIVQLERRAILEALGEPTRVPEFRIVSQVLESITDQVKRRCQQELAQTQDRRQSLNLVASALQETAVEFVETQAETIKQGLNEAGLTVDWFAESGKPGNNDWWYRAEVVQTARDAKHWVNLNEDRFWVKLSISPSDRSRAPRLVYVASLHHVGRRFTGIMAATAFAQILSRTEQADNAEEPNDPDFRNCAVDAFVLTTQDEHDAVATSFTRWIEESLSVALRHWGEFVE